MSFRYRSGTKSEWLEQARRILSGEIETSVQDIPSLLEWIQDMNWPGAPEIAEHLAVFGTDLIEPVRDILRAKDPVWKYWVLTSFANRFNREFWVPLSAELKELADDPKDVEGINLKALWILATARLLPQNCLVERIEAIRMRGSYDSFDLGEIEAVLRKE